MGDDLNPLKKWKKRAKRFLCAAILMLLIGIACLVCGIGLIAKFASYWGDSNEKLKSGVSYFGVAILILGLILLAISIGIFVTLCIVYRRIEGSMTTGPTTQYHLKKYAPGEAPYPQQKGYVPMNHPAPGGVSPNATPEKGAPIPAPYPSEPSAPTHNPAHQGDVTIEVSENYKF